MIRENLLKVEENIKAACGRAGRDPEEVTLIAVSKTKPMEMIEEALACAKKDVVSHILIEVNVANEESKFGIKVDETLALVEKIALLPHIRIEGLMTIAPFVENAQMNRPVFRDLRKLSVDIKGKNIDNVSMNVLSMGMTNDYEVAIEEGATYVRVGTAIFGERDYGKL